eukprot:TRINITY_DN30459_c0_g2_i1.p1 TRINITY_DN30459_c0_g2~~TRINITY_DN30459_c0_g2_i1.p1  ORF type:complete len:773 (+),score=187.41 TRINITY_DN30459_c0_g2_i1:135-2321(+)
MVDTEGTGCLDRMSAARFLLNSGLPQETLRAIWELADAAKRGSLDFEGFSAAFRLVAHAQANQAPCRELIDTPPPAMPVFQGVPSPGATTPRRQARSASPRPPSWAPSQRERRKYASLFKRLDTNRDGFVDGLQAKELLERSRLDLNALKVAWEHADADRDGRLNFYEFVVLVHLVSCVLRGLPLPPLRSPTGEVGQLPPELTASLADLPAPEVLAAEREASRSRSRSASPGPSGHVSPDFLATPPGSRSPRGGRSPQPAYAEAAVPPPALGSNGGWADPAATGLDEGSRPAADANAWDSDFPTASISGFSTQVPGASSGDGHGATAFGSSFPADNAVDGGDFFPSSKQEKKSKKDRSRKKQSTDTWGNMESDAFGAFPNSGNEETTNGAWQAVDSQAKEVFPEDAGFSGAAGAGASSSSMSPSKPLESSALGYDPSDRGFGRGSASAAHRPDGDQLSVALADFQAVMAADRSVTQQLRGEVDALEEELQHVRRAQQQLARQVSQERQEAERLQRERGDLERQAGDARRRLGELREGRRAVNLESISMRRDRAHVAEELSFLQRTLADDERTLGVVREANGVLEHSCMSLATQTEQLERQRRDVSAQVKQEQELVRNEERQNAEIRNALERQRRELLDRAQRRHETQLRERQIREMQGSTAKVAYAGGPVHSWATAVSSRSGGDGAVGAGSGAGGFGGASAVAGGYGGAVAAAGAGGPPRVLLCQEGV